MGTSRCFDYISALCTIVSIVYFSDDNNYNVSNAVYIAGEVQCMSYVLLIIGWKMLPRESFNLPVV